jgi:hypothetical protein
MGAVEEMSFEELVQTLSEFEQDREPSEVSRAMHRTAVERRLMALLGPGQKHDERRTSVRVPGDMPVQVRFGDDLTRGVVRDLSEGGIGVRLRLAPPDGATVEVELVPKKASALTHPAHAQALVVWVKPIAETGWDVGLAILGHDDAHRRHMRRLVLEILRRLP